MELTFNGFETARQNKAQQQHEIWGKSRTSKGETNSAHEGGKSDHSPLTPSAPGMLGLCDVINSGLCFEQQKRIWSFWTCLSQENISENILH